jgi:hypothetical protein
LPPPPKKKQQQSNTKFRKKNKKAARKAVAKRLDEAQLHLERAYEAAAKKAPREGYRAAKSEM